MIGQTSLWTDDTSMTSTEESLTLAQAASRLGVSVRTVQRRVASGQLASRPGPNGSKVIVLRSPVKKHVVKLEQQEAFRDLIDHCQRMNGWSSYELVDFLLQVVRHEWWMKEMERDALEFMK